MQQDFWTMEQDRVLEGLGFSLDEEETIDDDGEETGYKNEYVKDGVNGMEFINQPSKSSFIWEKFSDKGDEIGKKKFLTFSALVAFLKKA